jgi:hypothetical protein
MRRIKIHSGIIQLRKEFFADIGRIVGGKPSLSEWHPLILGVLACTKKQSRAEMRIKKMPGLKLDTTPDRCTWDEVPEGI